MKIDILILLERGIVAKQYAAQDSVKAEAIFNNIVESVLGDDAKDVVTSIDYGQALEEFKQI